MTCVIAFKTNTCVYIGVDQTGVSDDGWGGIVHVTTSKVWSDGPFVIGSAGSYRAIQLLYHQLNLNHLAGKISQGMGNPSYASTEEFMVKHLVPKVKETFESHGFSKKLNERSEQSAEFLIGIDNKLFLLQNDYAVIELGGRYAAIGSGMYPALGAMEVLTSRETEFVHPADVIKSALQATHTVLNTVGPPGEVLRTTNE